MLVYILSQPRSGSTVLTAILDKRKGIVCMPESSFPQVLGIATPEERADPRRLAALYLGSTFPPTPLSLDDAEACMAGSDEEILMALGRALAVKLGRNPADVTTVVWKTTRTIGLHRGPIEIGGKFIYLRRHPLNVFESQFRFDYGKRNRRPFRYAIFAQSYEHAFERLPPERTYHLWYRHIPDELPRIMEFLGVEAEEEWEGGTSSMDIVAKGCSWLTEVTKEWNNTDPDKRARLDPKLIRAVNCSLALTRPFRSLMGPLRRHFDMRSIEHIRGFSQEVLDESRRKETRFYRDRPLL